MDAIIYFSTMAVAFCGIIAGFIIANMAKEELKPGRKYFSLMQDFLIVLMLFFLLESYKLSIFIIAPVLLAVFLLLFYFKNSIKNSNMIIHSLLAVIFYLSSKSINLFSLEASLIFLYGLPTGSLISKEKIKNILKMAVFILIAGVLFLI
ncbi:MAG: hypothetical protein Q7J54_05525 [Candidatus Woesearchaeota archaeon]|nr:hypothetical protein [Candidatus Woesearchaeota archaeon]